MGKGIVDRLKQEFPVREEWLPFELHPEFPPEGVALNRRFPQDRIDEMYAHLRHRGEEFGITFGTVTRTSNSRLAHLAAEFARDNGLFEPMHEALLKGFFTHARDIGDRGVLLDIAAEVGLDRGGLMEALDSGRHLPRLERASAGARELGVRAAPTFVLETGRAIVGAQPLDIFRKAFGDT